MAHVSIPIDVAKKLYALLGDQLQQSTHKHSVDTDFLLQFQDKLIHNCRYTGSDKQNFFESVNSLILKSVIILRNAYVCYVNHNADTIYFDTLDDLHMELIKLLTDSIAQPDNMVCKELTENLFSYFDKLNESLKRSEMEEVGSVCDNDFYDLLESHNESTKDFLNTYSVLYNGYVVQCYLVGGPIPRNIFLAIQSIFFTISAVSCKADRNWVIQIITTALRAGSSENKYMASGSVILDIINWICRLEDAYTRGAGALIKAASGGNALYKKATTAYDQLFPVPEPEPEPVKTLGPVITYVNHLSSPSTKKKINLATEHRDLINFSSPAIASVLNPQFLNDVRSVIKYNKDSYSRASRGLADAPMPAIVKSIIKRDYVRIGKNLAPTRGSLVATGLILMAVNAKEIDDAILSSVPSTIDYSSGNTFDQDDELTQYGREHST